jgi:hypothetical protein
MGVFCFNQLSKTEGVMKKLIGFYSRCSFNVFLWAFLSLIGFIVFSSSALADLVAGDYTYTEAGGNATITGYTGAGGAISIPPTLGGYPTVAIGDNAFSGKSTITSVTIPDSVTSIGGSAFYYCYGLTSVNIPDSVVSIGSQAFMLCSALTTIAVDADNPNYSSLDGVLYNNTKTILIQFPGGKSGAFIIPGSVTSIASFAFLGCSYLTSVSIPAIVTSIGNYAFNYCSALTSITVTAGNSNYSSLDDVLYNQTQTTLIQFPGGKSGAFIIPSGVTGIATYAFAGCNDMTSVSIPDSVTSIGSYAFSGCTGFTRVNIPDSVTNIGGWAFFGCFNLTGAYFYGNAPAMGSYVFLNCSSGFTAYYLAGATGFINPWYGYPAAVFTPTGSLELIKPNGAESWKRNSRQVITWNATDCAGTLKLILWQNGGPVGTIADGVNPAAGSYAWNVGAYNGGVAPLGTGYSIKIQDSGSPAEDVSDTPFSIVKISVKTPNGGESWSRGTTQNITWVAKEISGQLRIVLFKSGVKVGNIVNSIDPALGTYSWTAGSYVGGTAAAGTGYQVQIREIGTDAGDRSDAPFTLTGP